MDGLKTGYTEGAGYCLTATMKQNDMRIIATVMGEPDSNTRNTEVSNMLDYAFAQVGLKKVLCKDSIVKKINMSKAKLNMIEIVPEKDVNILYKKINGDINPKYDVKINDINLPIKKGDIIGKIIVKNNNEILNEVNLTVKQDIDECNLFELYLRNMKNIITANINFN